jgi:O-glycosyl hydrolase
VVAGKSQFQNALPPKTVATYVWQAAQD